MRGDFSRCAEDSRADRVANGDGEAEAEAKDRKQGRLVNAAQVGGQRWLRYTVAGRSAYSNRDLLAMTGVSRSSSHSKVGLGMPRSFKSQTEYALLLSLR